MVKHKYDCELNWEMGDNAKCTCGADAQQESLDLRKQLAALQAENAKLRACVEELLAFVPYEKSEIGPLPNWIVEIKRRAQECLEELSGQGRSMASDIGHAEGQM